MVGRYTQARVDVDLSFIIIIRDHVTPLHIFRGDTTHIGLTMHHRLARQALLSRRTARPASIGASSSPPLLLLLRRHYASKTPGAPKQKQNFDKIMASLRPDMKTDEFARKMAALLVLSQHDQKLHARMVAAVRPLVHAPGVRRALLSKKVDLYMDEPPDDGYDAFVESLDAPRMSPPPH